MYRVAVSVAFPWLRCAHFQNPEEVFLGSFCFTHANYNLNFQPYPTQKTRPVWRGTQQAGGGRHSGKVARLYSGPTVISLKAGLDALRTSLACPPSFSRRPHPPLSSASALSKMHDVERREERREGGAERGRPARGLFLGRFKRFGKLL